MSDLISIREMSEEDIVEAAALQSLAFPPPFPAELLWQPNHLRSHLAVFPKGQMVAVAGGLVVGSCSNTRISEERWLAHGSWNDTVGGPCLLNFDPLGSTLYGLDITVHPSYRRMGVGRAFYERRFELVRELGLARYGTACRLPGYGGWGGGSPEAYAEAVVAGEVQDRTLTPLLRYGLTFLGVIQNYMEDDESGNAAALLEWIP